MHQTSKYQLDEYSLEDVIRHNTKNDAWTTVNGKVYDITNFLS